MPAINFNVPALLLRLPALLFGEINPRESIITASMTGAIITQYHHSTIFKIELRNDQPYILRISVDYEDHYSYQSS